MTKPTFKEFKQDHQELVSEVDDKIFKMIGNMTDPNKKYKINHWGKDHMAQLLIREDEDGEYLSSRCYEAKREAK